MTDDSIAALWSQLEASLRERAPWLLGELRPGASDAELDWLRGQGVPEDWVALYRLHDGEGELFRGWFWMRARGDVDTVEAELAAVRETEVALGGAPARWVPLAKDFSGETLCVDLAPDDGGRPGRLVARTPTGQEVLAVDARGWLTRLCEELAVGSWAPEEPPASEQEVHRLQCSLRNLRAWQIGEERRPPVLDPHELVLTRLDPRFWGDGLDTDPSRVLVFCVDGELEAGQEPRLAEVTLLDGSGAPVADAIGVLRQAGHEIRVPTGFPADAQLQVVVSVVERAVRDEVPEQGAARHEQSGRLLAAARAWSAAGAPLEQARCLAAAGDLDEARRVLAAADITDERAALFDLAAGRADDALPRLPEMPSILGARVLSALGRHDEALEQLDAVPRPDRAEVRWWRARVLEEAGRLDEAAVQLGAAADDLVGLREYDRRVARVRALQLRRRRDEPRAERVEVALTDEVLVIRDVRVDGREVHATVPLSPDEAEQGRMVDLWLPSGPLATRLPPGAGHGARLTLRDQGTEGWTVFLEVAITMPDGWRPDPRGRAGALAFDRWTVRIEVELADAERRAGARVPVATHAGIVHVDLAPGTAAGAETVCRGHGLAGPRGERGDLIVVWR